MSWLGIAGWVVAGVAFVVIAGLLAVVGVLGRIAGGFISGYSRLGK